MTRESTCWTCPACKTQFWLGLPESIVPQCSRGHGTVPMERQEVDRVHHHRPLDTNGHSETNGEDAVRGGEAW